MARHIQHYPQKCVTCRACEIICSLVKEGGFVPNLARIRINRTGVQKLEGFVCRQCDDAPCAKACPVKAISKRWRTGVERKGSFLFWTRSRLASVEPEPSLPTSSMMWSQI